MACVTLKRPLDHFEPLHVVSPGHGPRSGPPPSKRRRCVPFSRHREASRDMLESGSSSSLPTSNTSLVFRETPLSPAEIANNLRDELKRLRRRRQVAPYDVTSSPRNNQQDRPLSPGNSAPSSPEPMMDDATAVRTALAATSSAVKSSTAGLAAYEGNKPIFTLRQMTLICERMCKERTDQVREEYDRILHQKLSEQYDAFVKFIDHQIQQRFNESQLPSYLS